MLRLSEIRKLRPEISTEHSGQSSNQDASSAVEADVVFDATSSKMDALIAILQDPSEHTKSVEFVQADRLIELLAAATSS